jgi:hypothetical protein
MLPANENGETATIRIMEPLRGHQRVDQRSLELHRAIAQKLRTHPELLEIARDNLERWSQTAAHSTPYLGEWSRILDRPLPEILELIVEESEHMTAMRQNAPFAGILTPAERWAIYDEFAAKHPLMV